ncbi:hypothetical protein DEU56DRAFT_893483 [Suillus clintonianus]|uniref:uncharacterized protein n=1 Tax=Suillus clintonianus TaxID=1904413 RepID=UPI001B880944|nr:uncharacterized protein DEU56DRAFT_893483 [Suillus clintonianus]KAG2123749.1 hypothetical protein DEU56DRAFT_893483 [Suillus clintonianus]
MINMRRLVFAFTVTVIPAAVVNIGLGYIIARRPWFSDSRPFKGVVLSRDLSFQVDFGEPVCMRIDQTAHYRADTDEGGEEFAKLILRRGHTVHITDAETGENRICTVTLFHQLKCLAIIRDDYVAMRPQSSITGSLKICRRYSRK